MADQLKLFILFHKNGRPPERCLFPFVGVYMKLRPSDESVLVGGQICLISTCGMGPLRGDSTWRQISAKSERYSQQQKNWAKKHFVGQKLFVCRPQLFYCYVELLPAINSRATREKNVFSGF